jgi:hypothetical protein
VAPIKIPAKGNKGDAFLVSVAYARPIKGAQVRDQLEKVYSYFPKALRTGGLHLGG